MERIINEAGTDLSPNLCNEAKGYKLRYDFCAYKF
jgi:hypothetical protein